MKHKDQIYSERLALLRGELERRGVDGFIIPRADQYMGEEVPACSGRLAWLTGFTGSAGAAVVLPERAVVLTDGRYSIQVRQQVDEQAFSVGDITKLAVADWLSANVKTGAVVGFDPFLHTPAQIEALQEGLASAGVELRPLVDNPVDAIWENRPHPPMEGVQAWPERYAGRSAAEKLGLVARSVSEKGAIAAVITLPDSIAWLLNARSQDVEHTPVALSYAILRADPARLDWFIDPERLEDDLLLKLGHDVRVIGPHALEHEIGVLAREAKDAGRPVLLDFKRSPEWFRMKLKASGAAVYDAPDPCIEPKAIKTLAEQEAMTQCHLRDGLALVRFLYWLDETGHQAASLTEVTVAGKLEEFRCRDPLYRGPSFPTISGYGPHGAIVHYRATEQSNIRLKPPGLLLLDSGGQYEDGTTDVTRTIPIGDPGIAAREHFTLVLKAHIAVAMAVFPEGTPGAQIDALARRPLWEHDLDYAHGTGHGVGCYLSVHEESASLSPRGSVKIRAGHILSNEPGFYLEDEYGIRIENLVLAEKTGSVSSTGVAMLRFRTLTTVPIDHRLILLPLLNIEERKWLNAYHHDVWQSYRERLDYPEAEWLRTMTSPL